MKPYLHTAILGSMLVLPLLAGLAQAEEIYASVNSIHDAYFGPIFYFGYDWSNGKGLTDKDGNLMPDAAAVKP